MSIKYLFMLSLIFVVACSSGALPNLFNSEDAPEQQKTGTGEPVQGQINGQPWSFRSGRAYYKKSQPNSLVVQLWNEDFEDPCSENKGSTLQMRLTAPNQVGSWTITQEDPFNANLAIFFADLDFELRPRDNMRADRGEIHFFDLSKNQLSGMVSASFQNPNVGGTRVRGDFTVPICQ